MTHSSCAGVSPRSWRMVGNAAMMAVPFTPSASMLRQLAMSVSGARGGATAACTPLMAAFPSLSAQSRHHVFSTTARAGRPALGDRLVASVEAHALGAVNVVVAEQRVFPAAKRMERHRHRDRHVHADHADVDPRREVARRTTVRSKDRNAVAVFVRVHHAHRAGHIRGAHNTQDGTEDLLLVDTHVCTDMVEQRTA